jgi:hypothetical protein
MTHGKDAYLLVMYAMPVAFREVVNNAYGSEGRAVNFLSSRSLTALNFFS